jgi:chromosome segregation ATPase
VNTVQVVIAVIGAVAAVTAGFMAARAQRGASLIEGYDEFVSHLRSRLTELELAVERWREEAANCRAKCDECRSLLAASERLADDLRRELSILREQFGIDVEDRHADWGRRRTDVELPLRDDDEPGHH